MNNFVFGGKLSKLMLSVTTFEDIFFEFTNTTQLNYSSSKICYPFLGSDEILVVLFIFISSGG